MSKRKDAPVSSKTVATRKPDAAAVNRSAAILPPKVPQRPADAEQRFAADLADQTPRPTSPARAVPANSPRHPFINLVTVLAILTALFLAIHFSRSPFQIIMFLFGAVVFTPLMLAFINRVDLPEEKAGLFKYYKLGVDQLGRLPLLDQILEAKRRG